jgi:hypothetical protein
MLHIICTSKISQNPIISQIFNYYLKKICLLEFKRDIFDHFTMKRVLTVISAKKLINGPNCHLTKKLSTLHIPQNGQKHGNRFIYLVEIFRFMTKDSKILDLTEDSKFANFIFLDSNSKFLIMRF